MKHARVNEWFSLRVGEVRQFGDGQSHFHFTVSSLEFRCVNSNTEGYVQAVRHGVPSASKNPVGKRWVARVQVQGEIIIRRENDLIQVRATKKKIYYAN